MSVFSIYDGRPAFWQWDLNQKIIVAVAGCDEVHFGNGMDDRALVCEVYEQDGKRVVNVPNVLLQSSSPLVVFAYTRDENGDRTTHSGIFNVIPRAKPDDYVYTEPERQTWERLDERITALENDADGKDGVSPQVKIDPTPSGYDITIIDVNGRHTFEIQNGKDGYTPQKGVDYWTEDDKAEMVADVVSALPVYNGEVVE